MATATSTATSTRRRAGRATPAEPATPDPQPQQARKTVPPMRLELMDPRTLILDGNIRTNAELDPQFVDSIRERGVMAPILAVQTDRGVQVRHGQRRTLASIEARLDRVPVVVIDSCDGDEVERILSQWDENFHRRGLGVTDQVSVAGQLAAFGLPAETIAAKLRTKRTAVEQALAVAGSELARKAAPRYDLDLSQAAAVAEFESDPESVKLLVVAAKEGPVRFEHELERLRELRALRERRLAAEAALDQAKVRRLTAEQVRASGARPLSELAASTGTKTLPPALTPGKHKRCPGHAAYVLVRDWANTVETVYVCTDPKGNGHHDRYSYRQPAKPAPSSPAEQETARDQRRTVIANNRAWQTAEGVRRRWLKTYLTRKSPDKGTAAFVSAELTRGSHEIRRAMEGTSPVFRDLMDCQSRLHIAEAAASWTEARAQVIGLAVVLAALEESLSRETWRTPSQAAKRYFTFLTQHGYQLSDVEQLVLGKPKPTRKTATGKTTSSAETTEPALAELGGEETPAACAGEVA